MKSHNKASIATACIAMSLFSTTWISSSFAAAPKGEPPADWASRLAKSYDPRGALEISNSRDPKGTAKAMLAWKGASEARGGKINALSLMIFVNQYSPIWNGSSVDDTALDTLMQRLKVIDQEQIKNWQTALASAQGDQVSDDWAAGILITLDCAFSEKGFDPKRADTLRVRLTVLPRDSITALANKLNTAKGVVAAKMISQDALFSGDKFNQTYFDESMKALDSAIAKK